MKEVKNIGTMCFWLQDDRDIEYNESISVDFPLYGTEDGECLGIEKYHYMCRKFAAAMGFSEKTIDDWFGPF